MDVNSIVENVVQIALGVMAFMAVNIFNDLKKSTQELSHNIHTLAKEVAILIQRQDSHREKIEEHDDRLQGYEDRIRDIELHSARNIRGHN